MAASALLASFRGWSAPELPEPALAVPDNDSLMEPMEVPRRDDTHALRYRHLVADILEARHGSLATPADVDYPLVPGCEPLLGRLRDLPAADLGHHLLSRGICWPGQWVDSWFGDVDADFFAARTLVRIIGSGQWQQQTPGLFDLRVDARIALAHTEDRLSLILRSDDQQDDRLAQRDRQLVEAGDGDPGVFRIALRWVANRTRKTVAMLDVGVRGTSPVVPFVRTRLRYGLSLPWQLRLRTNQEFYWRDNADRRGSASELQLERAVGANSLLRLTGTVESNSRLRREDTDWQWAQTLSWFWRIRHRAALQISLRSAGTGLRSPDTQTRRLSLRLRHSVWRPWLYLELEPYLSEDHVTAFESQVGTALRLELQLGDYQ